MTDRPLYTLAFAGVLALVLLGLLRVLVRLVDRGKTSLRAAVGDENLARSTLHAGDVLATFLLVAGTVSSTVHGRDAGADALWALVFGVSGLVVYLATARLGLRPLLKGGLVAELERGNPAAGVVAGAHAVATGIITAKAMAGDDLASLGLSLVFFTIGQLTLHLYVALFRALTTYDDAAEILGENVAVALSHGGVTVGLAIVIGRALEGNFVAWTASLEAYAIALAYGLGLFVARQLVVHTLLLGESPFVRGGRLDHAIARERNVALGTLEALVYVGTALLLARIS